MTLRRRTPVAHGLFEAVGIEIEYMIVDTDRLDVRPIADRLLRSARGRPVSEVRVGPLRWSNELVAHVIELKTDGPASSLDALGDQFHDGISQVNARLASEGACLMPTGAHPWMQPALEALLWPHGSNRIYRAFDRIFNCRGHGWSNLQSMHINLPFNGDDEFGRLHAAVRMLLPLLPGLAASTPMLDGHFSGHLDSRLVQYRANARNVPSMAGAIVPEPAFSRRDYRRMILDPIYHDLAPLDPAGVLRHEWVNARGAIARFARNTIEIRLLDTQECARADLAIARLIVETLRALTSERWSPLAAQCAWPTAFLSELLDRTIRDGDRAVCNDPAYGRCLGYPESASAPTAGDIWRHLTASLLPADSSDRRVLEAMLSRGCLARRILDATGPAPTPRRLHALYRQLCDGLAANTLFAIQSVSHTPPKRR